MPSDFEITQRAFVGIRKPATRYPFHNDSPQKYQGASAGKTKHMNWLNQGSNLIWNLWRGCEMPGQKAGNLG